MKIENKKRNIPGINLKTTLIVFLGLFFQFTNSAKASSPSNAQQASIKSILPETSASLTAPLSCTGKTIEEQFQIYERMAKEVIEYEIRGYEYLHGLSSCRPQSDEEPGLFRYFHIGNEPPGDDSTESENLIFKEEVLLLSSKNPYKITKITPMNSGTKDDRLIKVDFDVYLNDQSKTESVSLLFTAMNIPADKIARRGCIIYEAPPAKTILKKECLDTKKLKQ